MSGLRSVATAIAVMVFATPLLAQSATTVADTTALARLPVSITTVAPMSVPHIRPAAPRWTTLQATTEATTQATTTPVAPRPATWSNGDGSHATATAMMIVGGASLLVGTVISGKPGSMIMIGGGLLGLVGLWRYAK
jgi:hypothetical protein